MENLARREYDPDADKKVKEELQIAGIPVVRVGLMNNEAKTYYIGILNGFVFIRAWYYWIVKGNMPIEYAQYLYDNYQDLNGVKIVELKSNCDKISLYVLLESNVKEDNIYAIILQIEDRKKMYNNDDIFEIYLENENLKYLIIIDKNETIDIDYVE